MQHFETPAQLRRAIREGRYTGPTAQACPGYVQVNVVILPESDAGDFERFCRWNARACPLLLKSSPGEYTLAKAAARCDIRTDVPRYRVFRTGRPDEAEPQDIRDLWRDDFVTFLLGCSFTFDEALRAAGLPVRHIEEGKNVPMYRTNVQCRPSENFAGLLVVSMRPFAPEQVEKATEITGQFPRMHGAPIHAGDPRGLGIEDLAKPCFGDAVTIWEDEVPLFWACGTTPQLAILEARPQIAITHSPGCMFVTDWRDEEFRVAVKTADRADVRG